MIVIGMDPGLASLGLAAVELLPDGERVVAVEVVTTAPSSKKAKVLVAHDDVRRVREVLTGVARFVEQHRPVALCAELPAGARSARAAAALGAAKAIVAAVVERHGLPLAACSPQQLKVAVAGSKKASKDDVAAALVACYGQVFDHLGRTKLEHGADAVGAVVACLDAPVVMMARRMAS